MTDEQPGFLRERHTGIFKVKASRVAPESVLATECLVDKLYQVRHLARGRLLDVGCSTKPYKPLYSPHVSQYVGVDVPFSEHTKKHLDVFGRAEQLPFKEDSFDTVLLTEVLEHVPDPVMALHEIGRVLSPGGKIILSVPFMYRVHEAPYDFFRYTPFSMAHMAKTAGLEVTQVIARGGYLTVFSDLSNKGIALLWGSIRRLLKLKPGTVAARTLNLAQRAHLTPLQKFQWLLLRKERLGADRYTLGYVFVLEKKSSHRVTQ